MYRTRKYVCQMVVFCFLIVPLSSKVWAEEKADEEAPVLLKELPHISFDSTSYDAGEVWEGDEVVHDFTVKNTGTAELNIARVKPG